MITPSPEEEKNLHCVRVSKHSKVYIGIVCNVSVSARDMDPFFGGQYKVVRENDGNSDHRHAHALYDLSHMQLREMSVQRIEHVNPTTH